MLRFVLVAIYISLGCYAPAASAAESAPSRVVSMNLCTDQLAILLARPGQLYSVSHLAVEEQSSVLAAEAAAFRVNHGLAEEIFLMKPDLIIAGTYTTRATVSLLRRLGFRVEEFAPEASIQDIRLSLRKMGALLGQSERAEVLIAEFDKQLDAIRADGQDARLVAAPYYANNYTSGSGTLVADAIEQAGLNNLATKLGLKGTAKLPLESLVMNQPDLLITSGRWGGNVALAQEVLRHPAFMKLRAEAGDAAIPDKYWICGAPFTVEAIRLLRAASKSVEARRKTLLPSSPSKDNP